MEAESNMGKGTTPNVQQLLAGLTPEQVRPDNLLPTVPDAPDPATLQKGAKKVRVKAKPKPKEKVSDQQSSLAAGSSRTLGRIPKVKSGTASQPSAASAPQEGLSTQSGSSTPTMGSQPSRTSGSKVKKGKGKGNLNRTWTAPGYSGTPASSSSTPEAAGAGVETRTGSAYDQRAGYEGAAKICYDLSSFNFVPEDDRRVTILLRKIQGDSNELCDSSSALKIVHNFPTVFSNDVTGIPLQQAPGAQAGWDEDKYLSMPELASTDPPEDSVIHPIPKKESVAFILIARDAGIRGGSWDIPAVETCKDFLNDVICKMYNPQEQIDFADAYDRTGKWGKVTLLYLHTRDMSKVDNFRRQMVLWNYLGLEFDTFPKDVATAKPDLTILLKDGMKTFQLDVLPMILFSRNKDSLAGSLRVLHTRLFPPGEKSNRGESKEKWRQIDLKGDDQVLRCLRYYPESTPFLLGVDKVQIRGGLRPPEPLDPTPMVLGKRSWSEAQALCGPTQQPLHHQQQQQQQQQQQSQSFPNERTKAKKGKNERWNKYVRNKK